MPTTATTTSTAVRTFAVDKTHSEAAFQVRHLITKVRGRFTDFNGTIAFDAAEPTRSTARFVIDAASIDTNTPDRDKHLRSEDFFAVERFPTIQFESTGITRAGSDDRFTVTGRLTIRDVTHSVDIPMTFLGHATDPWGNEKIAFEGELTINRKDYGLNWNAALETGGFLVGDDVRISLSIQAAAAE